MTSEVARFASCTTMGMGQCAGTHACAPWERSAVVGACGPIRPLSARCTLCLELRRARRILYVACLQHGRRLEAIRQVERSVLRRKRHDLPSVVLIGCNEFELAVTVALRRVVPEYAKTRCGAAQRLPPRCERGRTYDTRRHHFVLKIWIRSPASVHNCSTALPRCLQCNGRDVCYGVQRGSARATAGPRRDGRSRACDRCATGGLPVLHCCTTVPQADRV